MSNTTTPATSDDALRAENEALKAQLAEIDKALGEWRGNTTLEKAQATQRYAKAMEMLTDIHDIIQMMCPKEDLVQCQAAPAATEETPLETSEADARELPPEVVAKFVTTL